MLDPMDVNAQERRQATKGDGLPHGLCQQTTQAAGALRAAQFAQRSQFDLPYALARNIQIGADFLQRVFASATQTKAQTKHLFFARNQRLQKIRRLHAHLGSQHRIGRRSAPAIRDQFT